MASHRRPKQPSRSRLSVLTATAAAAVALMSQAAHADPKPTKNEVKTKVDDLYEDVERATEEFNRAKERQRELEKRVEVLQDRVARVQDEINELRNGLGSIATAQYRSGSIDPSVQLLLSSDPDSYLDKASLLDQLSAKQAETLRKISAKQRILEQQREEAADKLADLDQIRKELSRKKKDIQGKLSRAQKLLNALTAKERAALEAQERERADRAEAQVSLGGSFASRRAADAFRAAKGKVGSPYVWGASGPDSFDCSGLTFWAYGRAGVHLPRTSQEQAKIGSRIDRNHLRVGDLVFFYADLHHVGFYAGNGQILHAPRTGRNVSFESINNMPFQFGVRL